MSEELRKSKDRSPNFPFIALETALNRAHQFYAKEKRGAAPFRATAAHWSYSPASSGAIQTVAALKSYGLMSDDGSGAQRTVRLTPQALRILLDQRPDSAERAQLLREAAVTPQVAQHVYTKFEEGLPSEATLRHYLVFDLSFNDSTAHKVVKILFANHEFVGLDSSVVSFGDKEPEEDMNQANTARQAAPVAATPVMERASHGAKVERIIAPDADVLIQFTGEPTWDTYDFIEKYVALRKTSLKGKEKPKE